jgi:hypothetical protein
MQHFFSRRNPLREPLLRRLDRAAGQLNPFLMVIAIGLAVLVGSCLIALLDTGSLAVNRRGPGSMIAAPATAAAPY